MNTIRRGLLGLLAAAVFAAAPACLGQQAPEGNAHPQSHAVSEDARSLPNPFGEPAWTAEPMSIDKKEQFAGAVDLSPLRGVAVFHDGRVKILDTLARESVVRLVGRKAYQDFTPATGTAKASKFSYDPLFTLLDLSIDPGYYAEKPLLHVEFLPLRREFLEAAFPKEEADRDRWMKLTRITPRMAMAHGGAIFDRHDSDLAYVQALNRLGDAVALYEGTPANWMTVAPDQRDLPWRHLSSLPDDAPARRAALALGAAWRAGDAAAVNEQARVLAAELGKINPGVYPESKRDLELAYNKANAFEWGFWAYCAAFISLILAFGTGRRTLAWTGGGLLALAVGLHAFGFVSRCIIAERFAIQNQFESMTGLSLFATIAGLGIMIAKRQWLFGAAAAGVGFLVLITATQTAIPGRFIEREAAILNTSVLLKYHVTTVLVSYGLISLGMIVSLFYLTTYYAAKWRGAPIVAGVGAGAGLEGSGEASGDTEAMASAALGMDDDRPGGTARLLHDLDTAQMTVLQLAFWTLGVGILLGAWWADHSWGRWWAFDPKETWALVTWIIYLIVIHLRFTTGHNRALVTAWMSVLGFLVMIWTYFGVNLLLPGLHAYA